MPSPEALKRQISSAQELLTVAKTMKALAATNIRQYEQAVVSLQQYSHTLTMGMQILLINHPHALAELRPRTHQRLGAVIFGSDQGMCGRFNEQLAQFVVQALQQYPFETEALLLLVMGSRICDRLMEQGYPVERCLPVPASIEGITAKVQTIVIQLETWRQKHQVDQILVFHNFLAKGTTCKSHQQQLFPLEVGQLHRPSWPSRCRPMVFLSQERLFSALFRQHFFVTLYRACAESLSSENASRLASMQLAQTNIEEHLIELKTTFQQQRQTTITEELLDIMSGFEALNP